MKANELPEFQPAKHGNLFLWVLLLAANERLRLAKPLTLAVPHVPSRRL